MDEATIYRWIERWRVERSLADQPREGRPLKLDEKDKEEIRKLVEENDPKRHGVNASFWDSENSAYTSSGGEKLFPKKQ